MKRRRHTPEQVVRKLREADRLLPEGADVALVCRTFEVSVRTYQRWRVQYKAMRPEDVARLKALDLRTKSKAWMGVMDKGTSRSQCLS